LSKKQKNKLRERKYMIMNKNRPLFQNIQWQKLDTNGSCICSNAVAEEFRSLFCFLSSFIFFSSLFFFFKLSHILDFIGDPDKKIWTSINFFFFRILDSSKHKDKNEGLFN